MNRESPLTKRVPFSPFPARRTADSADALLAAGSRSTGVRRFMNARQIVSTSSSPMPGFTYHATSGRRVEVSEEPEYDRHGNGTDDLWYIEFDAVGVGSLYDPMGRFQALISVSQCAGYVRDTLLGAGSDPAAWENVAQGSYWVGCNGVLYNASQDEPRYRQAVN